MAENDLHPVLRLQLKRWLGVPLETLQDVAAKAEELKSFVEKIPFDAWMALFQDIHNCYQDNDQQQAHQIRALEVSSEESRQLTSKLEDVNKKMAHTLAELTDIVKILLAEAPDFISKEGSADTEENNLIRTVRTLVENQRTLVQLKEKARIEADMASRAKSDFLATMSHEIRTPMNAVMGMTSLLLNTPLNAEQKDFVETVRTSSDAMLTLINDILDFSKIEAGQFELENIAFDLGQCVEESVELLAARSIEKGLDLASIMTGGVPPAIFGDITRLRQILVNLLSNAIKFTEKGEVVLEVSRLDPNEHGIKDFEADCCLLKFSVHDTGIGIPADRLNRLFKAFSQVDASTTRRYGGTGLGLAISRRLVEMMGGTISVESEVGRGTKFFFTLKFKIAPPITQQQTAAQAALLKDKRVLIVDDSLTIQSILSTQMRQWNMQPTSTGSTQEASALLSEKNRFDLVLLDTQITETDIPGFVKEIRKQYDADQLPIIMLTSLGKNDSRLDASSFSAYLNKPIKPSQLLDTVIMIFDKSAPKQTRLAISPQVTIDTQLAEKFPLRILLADDNLVNQKVISKLLGKMGYQADLAANGLEVLESIKRQTYDLVLMDIQMPEMDGLEATRRIREAETKITGTPHIYVVALTAEALQGDRERFLAAGMDDYLSKPIRVDALQSALQKVVVPGKKGIH